MRACDPPGIEAPLDTLARWNLRHLWAFSRVAALRSINAAAAELHFSQPAISQGIAHLEDTFGHRLFARSATGMHTNAMGEILAARLVRGFAALSRALMAADPVGSADPSLALRATQLSVLVGLSGGASPAAAAAACAISEKSVVRHVRNLEARLDRAVLLRDGETVRLNRLGESLARAAKLFAREIEMAREEMSASVGPTSGRLVIGALPLARSFIVPRAMLDIAEDYPEIGVQLVEAPYDALLSGLREGDIDLLVGALRDGDAGGDIAQHPLFSERLCVVARRGHPVLSAEPRSLADLLEYPWIAPRRGSPARQQFDALMQAAPSPPRILLEVASHIAVRSVLLQSDGLALISRHQIRYEEAEGHLAVVSVPLGQPPRDVGYTVRADWAPTPVQRRFLDALKQAAAQSCADVGT